MQACSDHRVRWGSASRQPSLLSRLAVAANALYKLWCQRTWPGKPMTLQVAEQAFVAVGDCEVLGKYTLRKGLRCSARHSPAAMRLELVLVLGGCQLLLLLLIAILLSKADPGA